MAPYISDFQEIPPPLKILHGNPSAPPPGQILTFLVPFPHTLLPA